MVEVGEVTDLTGFRYSWRPKIFPTQRPRTWTWGSSSTSCPLTSTLGTTRHLLADALGSTLALTDPAGAVQTQYSYAPFGTTTSTGQWSVWCATWCAHRWRSTD